MTNQNSETFLRLRPDAIPLQPSEATEASEQTVAQLVVRRLRELSPLTSESDASIVRVPLRISPVGAHIDHQGGVVTGMTLNRYVWLAYVAAESTQILAQSLNFPGEVSFNLPDIPPSVPGDWGNYLRGTAQILNQESPPGLRQGMHAVIGSAMPIGGLSSSAAVEIAYLSALAQVNRLELDPPTMIRLARRAENRYVGVQSGVLDQATILMSQPNHLTVINCGDLKITTVPLGSQAPDFDILVAFSGIGRSLAISGYNQRVAECQEAARLLLLAANQDAGGTVLLNDVDPKVYQAYQTTLPVNLQRRAEHFFGETERVGKGIEAWKAGDLATLGRLMFESGQSSIDNYQCGSPELTTLHQIMARMQREDFGVLGARFSGGGFGGSLIALTRPAARAAIKEKLTKDYLEKYPHFAGQFQIFFCRPGGGPQLLSATQLRV